MLMLVKVAPAAVLLSTACGRPAHRNYSVENARVTCKTQEFGSLPNSFVCDGEADVAQGNGDRDDHLVVVQVLKDGKPDSRGDGYQVVVLREGKGKLLLYHYDGNVPRGTDPKPPVYAFAVLGHIPLY
jgi:hypothetical protein